MLPLSLQLTCTYWNHSGTTLDLVEVHYLNRWHYRCQADSNFVTNCRLKDWDNLALRGWKWFKMTWTPTNLHGLKQSTWLRTDHCAGCWRLVVLTTRRGARQRRWQNNASACNACRARYCYTTSCLFVCPILVLCVNECYFIIST